MRLAAPRPTAFLALIVLAYAWSAPPVAEAKPDIGKCHQKIAKATEKLRSQAGKALAKCVETVRKDATRAGVSAKTADKCEKSLAKIYNIGGRPGKGAIHKLSGSIAKLFRPGRETCTSSHLETLGLLESQRNAPGVLRQDFFAAALALQTIELAYDSQLAVSASSQAAFDELVMLTDCHGANAATGPRDCVGEGDPAPCCTAKNRGTCRPNLCAMAAARQPDCRTHTCQLSTASGAVLQPDGVPAALGGRQLSLTVCRAPEHADAFPVDVGAANRLLLARTARSFAPPPVLPVVPGFTVCLDLIRGQGWCDCDGGLTPYEPTSCRDHVVNDDLGFCAEATCQGGTPGNKDEGDPCATDADCDEGNGRCEVQRCRSDADCGKRGLCTGLLDGSCSDDGAPCSASTDCSGRRAICLGRDDCGADLTAAKREAGCVCAGTGTACDDAACAGSQCRLGTSTRACQPGTYAGAATTSWTGFSGPGDCVLLNTFSLSWLPPALCVDSGGDVLGSCVVACSGPAPCAADGACVAAGGDACVHATGDDLTPCTRDDRVEPGEPFTVAFTTGTATTTVATRVGAGDQGSCSAASANAGVNCLTDADCARAADPNAPAPACEGVAATTFTSVLGPGAGVGCGALDAGQLSGLRLVGAMPELNSHIGGDAVTELVLDCE